MSNDEIDRLIDQRLPDCTDDVDETELAALAVLIDADLTEKQRALAFQDLLTEMVESLSADEVERFIQIAVDRGERAALHYLPTVTKLQG